jgi:hypothetical protein
MGFHLPYRLSHLPLDHSDGTWWPVNWFILSLASTVAIATFLFGFWFLLSIRHLIV